MSKWGDKKNSVGGMESTMDDVIVIVKILRMRLIIMWAACKRLQRGK